MVDLHSPLWPPRARDVAFPRLVRAVFRERPNRFLVRALVQGRLVDAASRDPGRLRELLGPGRELRLLHEPGPGRKTAYTLALVRHEGRWVSLIPDLANRIFAAALLRRGVPGVRAKVLKREVVRGESRFDFVLDWGGEEVLTEVKSATLVVGGRALFPDAPTSRGARHARELARHARSGGGALLAFLVQRSDARSLSPHEANDPDFTAALREAHSAGVRIRAFRCFVGPSGCTLMGRIPFIWPD
jgi:sugar fermentation stimulation protein A